MHRRARRGDDLGLNCRQLCISGSAPALQVGGSSRSSTPAKAKRRGAPHAGLVGQLSSTFAAPLEECFTLEKLHRVALQISGRLSSHRLAFAALVAAVSGRCTSMLRKGWSLEEANEALPLLGDLWQAGLLYVPGDTCRSAVATALATLVSGGRRETPPRSPSATALSALSRPSSTGSGSHAVPRENMEQRLKRWCRSCEIFESAASMELLTREGSTLVEDQLFEELKRTLAGAREEDLRKAAPKIKLGSVPLSRASALMVKARRPHQQSAGQSAEPSELESLKVSETISAIAFEVVRNTETASGETAVGARAALEEHGLVVRRAGQERCGHERLPGSSRSPPSTRGFFSESSEPGAAWYSPASTRKSKEEGPTGLPEFDGFSVSHGEHIIAAARKANSQLSALEGGLLRLEAARQEMRRAKGSLQPLHPLGRLQAIGLAEERRCSTRT